MKGAIDSRIAEEQARQQRAAGAQSATPSRSASTAKRPSGRATSPSKRSQRSNSTSKNAPTGKGPDPSEFDPEFIIGDDDEPSRAGTPLSSKEKSETNEAGAHGSGEEPKPSKGEDATEGEDQRPAELPTEVKVKLRKLEKLESKYSGKMHICCGARIAD